MMKLLMLTLGLTLVAAGPLERERRQINGCVDAFNNVPSPCRNNPTNQVYFPHPTDNTKFLQCDRFNRMYIVQCPQGEIYEIATVSCRARNQATTRPPFTPNPTQTPPQTGNPCTPANIATNHIYFVVPGDPNHFIECDLLGNANILACPSGLKWNANVIACVYPPNYITTLPSLLNPTTPRPGTSSNPCNAQAIASGKFFYPFPTDTHKFIQCDPWGDVFINSCPAGLIWNNFLETCYAPFRINGGNP